MRWCTTALSVLGFCGACSAGVPIAWDVEAEFSPTVNPNSPWVFGSVATAEGALTAFGVPSNFGLLQWWSHSVQGHPSVFRNPTDSPVPISNLSVPAHSLVMHPGPTGLKSAIEWESPVAGPVRVEATLQGIDPNGVTTDVTILLAGETLLTQALNGPGASTSINVARVVAVGDRLRIAVGFGANGTFSDDSTMLDLRVRTIPSCEADYDGSYSVDFADITFVLTNWGAPFDFSAITAALTHWGPC